MVCPVMCPPLILGGSILSKYLGLNDIIIGLWSGAFITTIFLIVIDWFNRKKIKFLFRKPLIFFSLFFLSYFPLYYFNFIIYYPFIWFLDKFLFGNLLGILLIISSENLNNYLIKKNKGKVYFKFQKVLLPIILLVLFSIILYKLL